ncbi:MAG: ATP-binding protein [Clostridia bacterium]
MKKEILKISLVTTLIALFVFLISGIFFINNATRTEAEENVKKLTCIYIQNIQQFDFADAVKMPNVVDKNTRLTVLVGNGSKVIYDNMQDPAVMTDHASREEILSAVSGSPKIAVRFSDTLGKQMIYYAESTIAKGGEKVIVRVAITLASVTQYMSLSAVILVVIVLAVAIFVNILAVRLSKKVLLPMQQISANINEVSKGNYEKLPLSNFEEIDEVIVGINEISEKLSRSIVALEEERNKLYFVVDSMQEGIVAIDCKDEISLINRYARGVFDVDNNVVGKNIAYLFDNSNILDGFTYGGTDNVRKIKGEGKTYLVRTTKLLESKLFVLIFSDITEEEEINGLKKSFFENASHELKTPITSIKGFTELMESDKTISDTSKKFLGIMSSDINRLLAIIDDMFTLTKLENDDIKKNIEEIDLSEFCQEVVARNTPQAEQKGVKLSVSGKGRIKFDREQLTELVGNLVDNAIKYNKDNGTVELIIKDNTLCVKDSGIGISQEHQSRIFERFYRVEKGRSRKEGGTGLGLAIAKHTAISNGATISVKSIVGVGSEFVIKFK